jgi:hypothetical protein
MIISVDVSDEVWPVVAGLLAKEFGPPGPGEPTAIWSNRAAAQIFSEAVAELMQPERPRVRRPDPRRIRPSRAR